MPHLVLHISPELQDHDWQSCFAKMHALMAPYADIKKCKSRINIVSQVYLGDGTEHSEVLVLLETALKPRPPEVLQAIGDQLFGYLKEYIAPILAAKKLQADPTVEIRILNHYWQN